MFWHEGLGFRPVEEDDLDKIRFLRNDPSTWIYLTSVGQISKAQQAAWYQRISKATDVSYYTIVEEVCNFPVSYPGDILGIIRMDEIDIQNRSVRIGADVMPDKRGQGWGTKTYKALMKYCFDHLGFHRIWLCVLEKNEVARMLYEKSGFKEEGRYREAVWRDGRWNDYLVMSILESEYRK